MGWLNALVLVFLLAFLRLSFDFANANSAQNSALALTESQAYIENIRADLDQLKNSSQLLTINSPDRDEIDSQIYALLVSIERVRFRDEYEWALTKEIIEDRYKDLLRNLHAFRITNSQQIQ